MKNSTEFRIKNCVTRLYNMNILSIHRILQNLKLRFTLLFCTRDFFSSTGCEVTEWTEWGECRATCGDGYQYRARYFAVSTDVDKCSPLQNKTQSRACNSGSCKNIFFFFRLIVIDVLWSMVFNANFKQYLVISCQSVSLVEETGVP